MWGQQLCFYLGPRLWPSYGGCEQSWIYAECCMCERTRKHSALGMPIIPAQDVFDVLEEKERTTSELAYVPERQFSAGGRERTLFLFSSLSASVLVALCLSLLLSPSSLLSPTHSGMLPPKLLLWMGQCLNLRRNRVRRE